MLLYLVRHAHAVDVEENPARPLSARGVADTEKLAEFFVTNGAFTPEQIWHSPLLRSRQTSDILVNRLHFEGGLVETTDLLPEDDPQEIASRLEVLLAVPSLAIVGHEPHLSALATLLIRGRASPVAFELKKGAVIALERTEGTHKRNGMTRWRIRWFITPTLLGTRSSTPRLPGT